jgi:hypothetical protein
MTPLASVSEEERLEAKCVFSRLKAQREEKEAFFHPRFLQETSGLAPSFRVF